MALEKVILGTFGDLTRKRCYPFCHHTCGAVLADIFLSYARNDLGKAKKLAYALETKGLSVWWDRRLLAGQEFSTEIEREIDGARKVIVLWSESAAQSRWVRDEAAAGAEQGKLCPVLIDGAQVPLGFRQFHTINMEGLTDETREAQVHDLLEQLMGDWVEPQVPEPDNIAIDPVLAVLPFDNLSSDEEMRYFSDGVSDEILTRLLHGSKIKLMGRASSFQYRDAKKGAAAKELSCTHILDGSIRRSGNRVRTSVHLFDVASDRVIWSNRFDDHLEDILDTQERIAESIATALNSEFEPGEDPGVSPDVYDRYLKAKLDSWALETLPLSIESLRQITEEAPEFADAWAQLAMWANYYSYLVSSDDAERYRTLARLALIACERLQYRGVESLIAQFRFLPPFGAFLEAAPIVERIQGVGANGAPGQGILCMHFCDIGMLRKGLEHAKIGYELDPDDLLAASMFVMSAHYVGDSERASELMKDYLSANPANYHVAITLASCAVHQRDWVTLGQLLDPQRLKAFPLHEYSRFVAAMRAIHSCDEKTIREEADKLISSALSLGAVDILSLVWISQMVEIEHVYDMLERVRIGLPEEVAYETGPSVYGTLSLFIDGLPQIREDPRFPKLAARLGLAQYWVQTGEWPDCADRLETLYPFVEGCKSAVQSTAVDSFYPPITQH